MFKWLPRVNGIKKNRMFYKNKKKKSHKRVLIVRLVTDTSSDKLEK